MQEGDEALLRALQNGDEHALAALLSRHAPAIYRFGLKMCRDPEDAKDVLQDTLLAAARGLRQFRGTSSLSTWLYSIARSFCIKKRRRSKHAPRSTVSLEHETEAASSSSLASDLPPDEVAAGRELARALDQAIGALDPIHREVLLLRDVEGLSASEVAEVLGVSVDAVKSRLHRARARVRANLEPLFPPEEKAARAEALGGCPDIVALFSRHLEGEIEPAICERMERHVSKCKRCGAACESLKHTLLLCQAERSGGVPSDVQEQVRRAVRAMASPA